MLQIDVKIEQKDRLAKILPMLQYKAGEELEPVDEY
jgi:hypothetical protein